MLPDLRTGPARLGVKPGDTVQLMADVTRIAFLHRRAKASFDPASLLDAFADAVGPAGDLLVPTFTFHLHQGDAFDVRRTRSISGVLANAALDHPGFLRTPHPLHSFAVRGAHARELATGQEEGSFGPRSPFAFLQAHRAKLIAIDLRLDDALTYVHFVEECAGVRYRRHKRMRFAYTDTQGMRGERTFSLFAKRPGHHMRFDALEGLLRDAGALVDHTLDGIRVLVVDLAAAHAVIERDIRENGARSIHAFRWSWWARDVLKGALRTFGIQRGQARIDHAARPR